MGSNPLGDGVNKFTGALRGVGWVLAMLLVAGGSMRAQTQAAQAPEDNPLHTATRVELDVAKAVLAQERAWNRGDIEGYAKGYKDSPETIFIGKQVLKGYAQIVAEYKRAYPTAASMGTLAFSELVVHPLDEKFVICTGKYRLERTKKEGGAVDGVFSMVLEKTGEGWKIVLDHTT